MVFELEEARKTVKMNKAAAVDDIRTEEIKQFGPRTLECLLQLMNNCIVEFKISKLWRQPSIAALLKPGKDSRQSEKLPTNITPLPSLKGTGMDDSQLYL